MATNYNQKNKKKSNLTSLADLEKQKEAHKQKLWDNRIALVKKGNLLVQHRMYGEAAVTYEKYLKILELIYDCKPNGLTPQMLKSSARTTELSVIAGIYWDLIRIYDVNNAYLPRQKNAADQLAKFANYTPLFADILKKAIIFQKSCRHPEVIKNLIAVTSKSKARCFIATAAFDSEHSYEVQILRWYRDEKLRTSYLGRNFIYYYYKCSPSIACFVDKHAYLKAPIRWALRFVIKCVT